MAISIAITSFMLWWMSKARMNTLDRRLKSQFIALSLILATLQSIVVLNFRYSSSVPIDVIDTRTPVFLTFFFVYGVLSRSKSTADLLGISLVYVFLENDQLLWFIRRAKHSSQERILQSCLQASAGLFAGASLMLMDSIWRGAERASPSEKLDERSEHPMSDAVKHRGPKCSTRRIVCIIGLSQFALAGLLAFMVDGGRIAILETKHTGIAVLSRTALLFFTPACIISIPGGDAYFVAVCTSVLLASRIFLTHKMSGIGCLGVIVILALAYPRLKSAGVYVLSTYICLGLVLLSAQIAIRCHGRSAIEPDHGVYATHPMQSLITSSQVLARGFTMHEESIIDLSAATLDYMDRYGRLPPPGFPEWFNYARAHNTLVVSNYDQIEADLTPFWAVQPSELRRRTYTAVQDRYNYISPLRIRNGSVTAPPMEIPTHYWMLERLMEMMEDFVQYLPDMDIAINLNDEPRILARRHRAPRSNNISDGIPFTLSSTDWKEDIPFTDETPASFEKVERLYRNTYGHSTRFCSDDSPAKMDLEPGQERASFSRNLVKNWHETLDICHQPQLKDTRGFFVSPSTYDASDELLPVFSQSKPSTFSDILLPSPWNFGDKVGPDTIDPYNWTDKWDRVYWRGSTTEGWATMGSWRQMLRQRFVDLLGGADERSGAISYKEVEVLEGDDSRGYRTVVTNLKPLHEFFDPDVFLVQVPRTDDHDANDQYAHFRLQPPSEFKDHWRHRYLLDADGAGFSGRFLPFLDSQSLPLKFTSVFTEWWSDRVFAYQHFVPITLESVYGTLSYFIGFQDGRGGEQLAQSHQDEGEKIALQGKDWARTVLRKEDMKIYLWRLLLEYGRVVDDARDHVGYRHNE